MHSAPTRPGRFLAPPPIAFAAFLLLALPALLALLALITAGCSPGGPGPPAAGGGGAGGGPRRGGTVVTGWTAEPTGVNQLANPMTQVTTELQLQLFLRLVEEQPDFQRHPPSLAPQLAGSYDWSPDHKLLTFHLREAQWSDGVPVTADDVRWTWQAETSPEIAWDYANMLQPVTDVEVVDPHTVRYHFSRAYAKQMLDVNEGFILPKHAWEKLPFAQWRQNSQWFRQHLVVDGPFTIAAWQPQQEIVLQRNPRYYDPARPYLDRVVMRIIPDQNSMMTQLLNGELDFAAGISPGDAPRVQARPELALQAYDFRTWVGVAWNPMRPLFADPEVRRALTLAIDRETIVKTLWGPYGRVADSPIMSTVWAHDRALAPWPYRPDEARRILAAKGWRMPAAGGVLARDGKPFSFELITNSGNQQRVDATVMIQEQLRRLGIEVQPKKVEFNTFSSGLEKGSYDAAITGLTMDTGLDLTDPFGSKSGGDTNVVRYNNPEVDRLIAAAMGHLDIGAARAELERIQEILHRDQPYTFLWESQRLAGLSRRVHDAQPNPLFSLFHLRDWWVEPRS
ncbi:MAG TPA: ABC transporter substrate-binding protein [Thermoanaerobaculia bacterium]|nr:ABC transporter substrate-binding protein [Thermoanaerobaculia bacterium]